MRKFCLFISIVLVFTMFSGINNFNVYAASTPMIKIGLFYGTKAQSQISVSGAQGVSFNAYNPASNEYIPVYTSSPEQNLIIRKDGYFTGSGSKLTPATETGNPSLGPYHIKLPNTYGSYNDTLPVISTYNQKGIIAYPVYTETGWNIWSGFYVDKATAQSTIASVSEKLGEAEYSVVERADTRICGMDAATGDTIFMYAAEKNLLRGKSAKDGDSIKIGTAKFNTYRGEVEFLRKADSDMTIINVLTMEQYLYGVVPNEIESYSNSEALKAQAVAARTYAYKNNKHTSHGFNLCNEIHCQVYYGMGSESQNTNKAVDATEGLVITYNGQLIEAVYSASSGGRTEDGSNVWTGAPYLKSVEDKYESGTSPKYNWTLRLTADEITQKLAKHNIGTVTSVEITKVSEAGRPIEVVVRGTLKPEGIKFTKDGCRTFLGLYSQWYTISTNSDVNVSIDGKVEQKQLGQLMIIGSAGEVKQSNPADKITIVGADGNRTEVTWSPTEFIFTGKGYGHGVGMSQEGAKGMANAGFTFDQILTHYYSGTKIEIKK